MDTSLAYIIGFRELTRDRRPDILRIPKRRKIKPGRGNRLGGRP